MMYDKMEQQYDSLHSVVRMKPQYSIEQVRRCLGILTFSVINDKQLFLGSGNYKQIQLVNLLPKIQDFLLDHLYIDLNLHPNIIRQISPCQFSQLQILSASCNQIQSIEPLQKIYMPALITLNLDSNYITNLNVLNKVNWPYLTNLILSNNLITQIRTRRLNFPFLQQLDFQSNKVHSMQEFYVANSPNLLKIRIKKNNLLTDYLGFLPAKFQHL